MARKRAKDSPKKPSFFKILVGDFSQRLRIPPTFIGNFNGQLLRECALRGPNGERWEVELEKRKNGLFFHYGWEDFVRDHCLQVADFLVFSYDGGYKFDVTIYDRSACEKDVGVAKRKKGSPLCSGNEGNEAEVQDEDVELDTGNYEEECEKETTDQDQIEDVEDYTGHRGIKRIVSDRRYCRYLVSTIRGGNTCIEETSTGLIMFKSENSCFLLSLKKKSYLHCPVSSPLIGVLIFFLTVVGKQQKTQNYVAQGVIPKELAVAEGLMTKLSVRLQDPSGRSWRVQLVIHQQSTRHSLRMGTGWCECRKSNGISLGDTIVFEFVKEGVLQIHIFKKREVGGRPVVIAAPNREL